jgi:hypothetical protein
MIRPTLCDQWLSKIQFIDSEWSLIKQVHHIEEEFKEFSDAWDTLYLFLTESIDPEIPLTRLDKKTSNIFARSLLDECADVINLTLAFMLRLVETPDEAISICMAKTSHRTASLSFRKKLIKRTRSVTPDLDRPVECDSFDR